MMPEPPPRKRAPSYGGIAIPPARESLVPSTPAPQLTEEEKKDFYKLWLRTDKKIDIIATMLTGRLDQHEDEIRELRENVTLLREVRGELREQGRLLGELAGDVRHVMRSDASQTIDLGKLEARVAATVAKHVDANAEVATQTAKESARSTSRKWSAVGSVIGAVVAAAIASGFQECNKPAPEPKPTYDPKH
jgi:hypothetical protein